MSILKFLGIDSVPSVSAAGDPDTEAVRKIIDELDHLPDERARFVAAFAFILSRVAHADMEISSEETAAMERIVVEHGARAGLLTTL